jgi:hypothetical protein
MADHPKPPVFLSLDFSRTTQGPRSSVFLSLDASSRLTRSAEGRPAGHWHYHFSRSISSTGRDGTAEGKREQERRLTSSE